MSFTPGGFLEIELKALLSVEIDFCEMELSP